MSFVWQGCDLCSTLDGKHSFPCYCRCHHAEQPIVSKRSIDLASALLALALLAVILWRIL